MLEFTVICDLKKCPLSLHIAYFWVHSLASLLYLRKNKQGHEINSLVCFGNHKQVYR